MAATESGITKKWGDADDDENDVRELDLPQSYETSPDENGIKVVVEYRTKEDGTRVKVRAAPLSLVSTGYCAVAVECGAVQ
jgi:hypothetical protein